MLIPACLLLNGYILQFAQQLLVGQIHQLRQYIMEYDSTPYVGLTTWPPYISVNLFLPKN